MNRAYDDDGLIYKSIECRDIMNTGQTWRFIGFKMRKNKNKTLGLCSEKQNKKKHFRFQC